MKRKLIALFLAVILPLTMLPAVESAHAGAHAMKLAPDMHRDQILVVNLSGRGDKDVAAIARYKGVELYE